MTHIQTFGTIEFPMHNAFPSAFDLNIDNDCTMYSRRTEIKHTKNIMLEGESKLPLFGKDLQLCLLQKEDFQSTSCWLLVASYIVEPANLLLKRYSRVMIVSDKLILFCDSLTL